MDPPAAIPRLEALIKQFARDRARDVERGAETSLLAALLLQKYGRGVCEAVEIIFDTSHASASLWPVLDAETARIDPHWDAHNKARWVSRPADLTFNPEPAPTHGEPP